eukprot:Clim_evm9s49 gene=Clim_evmTU9s49
MPVQVSGLSETIASQMRGTQSREAKKESLYRNRGKLSDEEQRRRRREGSVQLRRDKREECLAKKRHMGSNRVTRSMARNGSSIAEEAEEQDSEVTSNAGSDAGSSSSTDQVAPNQSNTASGDQYYVPTLQRDGQDAYLQYHANILHHPNDVTNLAFYMKSLRAVRKLLSRESNPPIQECIDLGLVSRFVELLEMEQEGINNEAAWALTNIASGTREQTMAVVQANAVEKFMVILHTISLRQSTNNTHSGKDDAMVEQCVWALANIAGDCTELRDHLLSVGLLPVLLNILSTTHSMPVARQVTWCISNLCRGRNPYAPYEAIKCAFKPLRDLLENITDTSLVSDACWAVSYLTDGGNQQIEDSIAVGLVPSLSKVLSTWGGIGTYSQGSQNGEKTKCQEAAAHTVVTPALRALGNIVTGTEAQTQAVLDENGVIVLKHLLGHARDSVRKEAMWSLSNICAGTRPQIASVIAADLVPIFVEKLEGAESSKVRRESAWALANVCKGGSDAQVRLLAMAGAPRALCTMLHGSEDSGLLEAILDALFTLLKRGLQDAQEAGRTQNPVADIVEECEGLTRIEELQDHTSEKIYHQAVSIIETFYGSEEDDDDLAGLMPSTEGDASTFAFGSTAPTAGMGGVQGSPFHF